MGIMAIASAPLRFALFVALLDGSAAVSTSQHRPQRRGGTGRDRTGLLLRFGSVMSSSLRCLRLDSGLSIDFRGSECGRATGLRGGDGRSTMKRIHFAAAPPRGSGPSPSPPLLRLLLVYLKTPLRRLKDEERRGERRGGEGPPLNAHRGRPVNNPPHNSNSNK